MTTQIPVLSLAARRRTPARSETKGVSFELSYRYGTVSGTAFPDQLAEGELSREDLADLFAKLGLAILQAARDRRSFKPNTPDVEENPAKIQRRKPHSAPGAAGAAKSPSGAAKSRRAGT